MNTLLRLVSLTSLLLLTGCASGTKFKDYSKTLPPPKEGEARVWFYRPSKSLALGVQPMVRVDDKPVGRAQPHGFFYADMPPGTYTVKCTTEYPHKEELTVSRNQVYYVRLKVMVGLMIFHVIPNIVTEKQALEEIQKCRLVETSKDKTD